MQILCVYFLNGIDKKNNLKKLAEACMRFSPLIAIGHRSLFLEIDTCRKLYSEESIILRIQSILDRFYCQAQVAIADDIPTSLAFAKYGVLSKDDLPVEALNIYASPFRPQKHLALAITTLQNFGVYTLKDILMIPRNSISSHFGEEVLLAIYYIDNAKLMPWPLWQPEENICEIEVIAAQVHILELEPLLFQFRNILDRVLLRLKGRGELLGAIEICIEQEKFSTVKEASRKWLIEFDLPQSSARSVLLILRHQLSSSLANFALESSVRQLEVRVIKTVQSYNKPRSCSPKQEEKLEPFYSIASRLIARLRRERSFVASPTGPWA